MKPTKQWTTQDLAKKFSNELDHDEIIEGSEYFLDPDRGDYLLNVYTSNGTLVFDLWDNYIRFEPIKVR